MAGDDWGPEISHGPTRPERKRENIVKHALQNIWAGFWPPVLQLIGALAGMGISWLIKQLIG